MNRLYAIKNGTYFSTQTKCCTIDCHLQTGMSNFPGGDAEDWSLILLDDNNNLLAQRVDPAVVDVSKFIAEKKAEAEVWAKIAQLPGDQQIGILMGYLSKRH